MDQRHLPVCTDERHSCACSVNVSMTVLILLVPSSLLRVLSKRFGTKTFPSKESVFCCFH